MGRKIEISPLSCIAGAALLIFLPIRWIFGAFLAASVHELAHLVHLNHSKSFHALVEAYLPDWKKRKKLLKITN